VEFIDQLVAVGIPIALIAAIALTIKSWAMLASIEKVVAGLEPRIRSLEENRVACDGDIAELDGRIDHLKDSLTSEIGGLSRNVDNLSKYMDQFAQSLGGLRENHAEWKQEFKEEQDRLFGMWNSQFGHFTEEMRELRKALDSKK
jgi:chromosome segregation ATPase